MTIRPGLAIWVQTFTVESEATEHLGLEMCYFPFLFLSFLASF